MAASRQPPQAGNLRPVRGRAETASSAPTPTARPTGPARFRFRGRISGIVSAGSLTIADQIVDWEDEPRLARAILMNTASAEQTSGQRPAPQFGEAEERKLAALFRLWREEAGLGAREERQFALLLRELVMT